MSIPKEILFKINPTNPQDINNAVKELSRLRAIAIKQEKKKSAETNEEMDVDKIERKRKEPEEGESTDFKTPRKTSKKPQTEKDNLVPVNNQFEVLATKPNEEPAEDQIEETPAENNEPTTDQTNSTPIILRSKEDWTSLNKSLKQHRINYTKAICTKSGIRIYPQTIADYKNAIKFMKEKNYKFFTHQLKNEKTLKIVIKGIPIETKEDEIKDDLAEQGYPITKITRMKSKGGKPAAMVLIELERKYKSFYNVNRVNGLVVKVESLRSKGIPQCHRCQAYGHIQANCNDDFRCMKCAGLHSTHLCPKQKTTPAKCANCDGEHTSISKLCKKRPKPEFERENTRQEAPTRKSRTVWNKNVPTTSESPGETPKDNEKPPEETAQTTRKTEITNELSAMMFEFSEKNPTEEEENAFSKHITKILRLLNGPNKN